MPDALTAINLRSTPQTQKARPEQVKNSAGGYTFKIDDEARLRRFLVLGTEGSTYYASSKDLTVSNADIVLDFARHRTHELVEILKELSLAGRTPRQNPILFALAAAISLGDLEGKREAEIAVADIVRTGTQMFQFNAYAEQLRGRGRILNRAVRDWFTERPVDQVAYQAVKYRQREGWTQRDLLRLVKPNTPDEQRNALFGWIVGKEYAPEALPAIVSGFERAQAATTVKEWVKLIGEVQGLSWEMFPDAALTKAGVWEALIERGMPQTALMRQLPRLTNLGLLKPLSSTQITVAAQLADPAKLLKARVHPINVLVALRTYASGQSARGSGSWTPETKIVNALDAAFYAAFGAVEVTGKRHLLALDVSGSMSWHNISGMPMTPREATGAMAMVTERVEPATYVMGFGNQFVPLQISSRQRMDDVLRAMDGIGMMATDCAVPTKWALKNKVEVDTFVIYTDNETYAGNSHPHQALEAYRQQMGIDARMVVCGMTATECSIADPKDPGSLDIAGFDSATPQLISGFSARSI